MNILDIYIKMLTLLYREKNINDENETNNDNSKELIKTILNTGKNKKINNLNGSEHTAIADFKRLILDLAENPDNYDKEMLLESIAVILKDKPDIIEVIRKTLNTEMSIGGMKKSVVSLRRFLNSYYKDCLITETILSAARALRNNEIEGDDKQEFARKLQLDLEALTFSNKGKDPAIVNEIDIDDTEAMDVVLDSVKNQAEGTGKLKTGWKQLNEMLAGGFRRGECVVIGALQHKYKSGFMRSLVMQIAMNNTPMMLDMKKKPLLIYISFEDNADIILEFMYKYLYYNENRQIADLSLVTKTEMSKYIKEKLGYKGYNVKILRVNPSEWTYKHIINKTLEYEADGFEIHGLFIDYLAEISTEGLPNGGPAGMVYRELWSRMRHYYSA